MENLILGQAICDKCRMKFPLVSSSKHICMSSQATDHVPDAGKMVTEREQSIEQAKKYVHQLSYDELEKAHINALPKREELMADFAIEYAREKERKAFEAARDESWHSTSEYSGHVKPKYNSFEDYLNRKDNP